MSSNINLYDCITPLRQRNPLVVCLTNLVAAPFNANALLAVGASPVMSAEVSEAESLVRAADALYVNIGTADQQQAQLMTAAVQHAVRLGTPWVLDPVGVGLTKWRTQLADGLLAIGAPAIIRCNASEALALYGSSATPHGVDSLACVDQAKAAACGVALRHHTVVAVSGSVDYITNGTDEALVPHGSPLMTKVTGMGCTASALAAACAAVFTDAMAAATAAMTIMGVAGERAADRTTAPGSLQQLFLDELYTL